MVRDSAGNANPYAALVARVVVQTPAPAACGVWQPDSSLAHRTAKLWLTRVVAYSYIPKEGWYGSSSEGRLMRSLLWLCAGTTCVISGLLQLRAQSTDSSELRHRLDEKVPTWIRVFNATGVSIAYIEHGKIAWTAYYGEQVPGGPAANEKTLYDVASLTKPITAEVIVRLASEGKLALDGSMAPDWIDPDIKDNPWSKLLTLRMCLSHRTGFANWRYQTKNVLTFQWEPGTKTGYSGEGFDYAARFAERKTGRAWEELAQQYVFDPAGMRDTSYTPRAWWTGRQAKPVEVGNRTKWSGAALLRTTVSDYARFMISVMNNENVTREIARQRVTVLENQITPDQQTVFCEDSPDPSHCTVSAGFGLSWHVVRIGGDVILDHTGKDADVVTLAVFQPGRKTGIVVFTDGPDIGHQIIDKILGILYPNRVYRNTLW